MASRLDEEDIELETAVKNTDNVKHQTKYIEPGEPEEMTELLNNQENPGAERQPLGRQDAGHQGAGQERSQDPKDSGAEHDPDGASSPASPSTDEGNQKKRLKELRKKVDRVVHRMAQRNDFVLEGRKDKKDQQKAFIEKLKEKKIEVEEKVISGHILYGLQASEELLKEKGIIHKDFDTDQSDDMERKFPLTRITFLDSILNETKIDTGEGLVNLIKNGVFYKKYCLYEKELKDKKKRDKRVLNEMAQMNDFILVGEKDKKDQQQAFIEKLKNIKIEIVKNELEGKTFYGLRASEEVIKNNPVTKSESTNSEDVTESISMATRIRFVHSILNRKKLDTPDNPGEEIEDLEDLIKNGVFNTKYCLYEALLTEYYYILVGPKEKEKEKEQEAFIKELKRKNIKVKKIESGEKIFYGLQAKEIVFKDYQYLLKVSDTCNSEDIKTSVSLATRIRIVHFILNRTKINGSEKKDQKDLEHLMNNGVFETKYCLHEENQLNELKEWANWKTAFNNQPFQNIRKHFGEKVALYFLWMGWYTTLLIPAAVLGLLVFLCGIAFFDTNPLIKEVCESNVTMCPRCEKICQPWSLKDTCSYAKVRYLFDNTATVVFALFMAGWATALLQLWKRYRVEKVSKWEVYDWSDEEEELILEIVNDPKCKPKKRKHSYLMNFELLAGGTFMMLVILALVPTLVVFRVTIRPLLSDSSWTFMKNYTNTLVVIFGAVLHTIVIQIMTQVNRWVSIKLSELDKSKPRSDIEKTFTIMMFTFQFFTLFSSIFYIAFFLGRINGYPGNYFRIAGQRLEECHPSGCLTDLFIQMATIMTISQIFRNIADYTKPLLMKKWRKVMTTKDKYFCGRNIAIPWPKKGSAYEKTPHVREPDCWKGQCDGCLLKYWEDNYVLADTDDYSLFYEIQKMVIQFSFTTLFVAAFPLAPLLALINNIITIRLAAIRMVRFQKLLVPKKTNSIGVWTMVLETIGVLAVITNGLVIGITSEFIPRLVYRYGYGPCARGVNNTSCMSGYINSSLTTAYMLDNNPDEFVLPKQRHGLNVTQCSFRGYRNSHDHSQTSQYWWVLAARFTFVIAFEHLLLVFKAVAAWFVPSDSLSVKNERLENKLERLKQERKKKEIDV